jgi:hypothetical protein
LAGEAPTGMGAGGAAWPVPIKQNAPVNPKAIIKVVFIVQAIPITKIAKIVLLIFHCKALFKAHIGWRYSARFDLFCQSPNHLFANHLFPQFTPRFIQPVNPPSL